ncbi:MAG: M20 family peptidase, partial [Verrucomicrobiia bacterium]
MNHEQITQLLQDLVRIPSVNPVGDPGTAATNTGEARIAEYVADFLRKLALDVELHDVEPG